jgi:predicted transcriptional regulator
MAMMGRIESNQVVTVSQHDATKRTADKIEQVSTFTQQDCEVAMSFYALED